MSEIEIRSLADLRDWLARNHASSGSAWLITWTQGSPYHVSWSESVDELLCWGWIDSQSGKVDDQRTRRRISPRNPASAWSGVNKIKVERMRAENRMQPAGEALVAAAQANGMWDFLTDVEGLIVPDDLARALAEAQPIWDGWPRSVRRGALEWIKTAKAQATRAARIAECAAAAREGRRPKPFSRVS